MASTVTQNATTIKSGIKIYGTYDDHLGDDYYIALGEKSIGVDPFLVFVALVQDQDRIRVIVFAGEESKKIIKASRIAKEISIKLGGTGGGTDKFAQGGGKDENKVQECLKDLHSMITSILETSEKNG
jgi:alanyl-tRNA synthetase